MERDPARLKYLDLAEAKFGRDDALKRFGQRDWQAYQQQGLIKETNVT